MILLTQETGFLAPIAWVLGQIFDFLFNVVSYIGLPYIGLCVILFTIIVRLLMMPLTIKQQKFSKLSNMMNPEIQAVQAKYKGKKDNDSLMKLNQETKVIYEKYGTSPTGGCLTMFIQLPIMFALYRVIYKIPGYVTKIKEVLDPVATSIRSVSDYETILEGSDISNTSQNGIIDTIYKFSGDQWTSLANIDGLSSISDVINSSADKILNYNSFLGINLTQSPGLKLSWALIIPILAGLAQWFSTKLMTSNTPAPVQGDQAGSIAGSMKVMNNVMPIMSAVFCISFPAFIGLYWITGSVVQIIQQLLINKHLNNMDIDEMVRKNVEKANAKRAKKGLPEKTISSNASKYVTSVKKEESSKNSNSENQKNSTDYYKNSSAKPGSLAAKAGMVKQYNEKKNKKSE